MLARRDLQGLSGTYESWLAASMALKKWQQFPGVVGKGLIPRTTHSLYDSLPIWHRHPGLAEESIRGGDNCIRDFLNRATLRSMNQFFALW